VKFAWTSLKNDSVYCAGIILEVHFV